MELSRSDRMKLLEFVCTFAWTDLQIQQEERDLVMQIAGRFALDQDEIAKVQGWLSTPPDPDRVDPNNVPREHRELFLEAAELTIHADGRVSQAERDQLAIFRALLK